jgi:hypothetical protein
MWYDRASDELRVTSDEFWSGKGNKGKKGTCSLRQLVISLIFLISFISLFLVVLGSWVLSRGTTHVPWPRWSIHLVCYSRPRSPSRVSVVPETATEIGAPRGRVRVHRGWVRSVFIPRRTHVQGSPRTRPWNDQHENGRMRMLPQTSHPRRSDQSRAKNNSINVISRFSVLGSRFLAFRCSTSSRPAC